MSYNVLLVDDSAVTRKMIGKTLRLAELPLGEVFEAADGAQALDLLERQWVDLVLTDLNMPVMDGVELVTRMRSNELLSSVPVVVVSTEAGSARADRLLAAGVSRCIRKPFTPEEVRECVQGLLGKPSNPSEDVVETAFHDALEGFAFMFGERLPVIPPAPADPVIGRVEFTGYVGGCLRLAMSSELAGRVAASAMGVDEDEIPFEAAHDALRELINVACGRVLAGLVGDTAEFSLAPPTSDEVDAAEWGRLALSADAVGFDIDGEPAVLAIELEA